MHIVVIKGNFGLSGHRSAYFSVNGQMISFAVILSLGTTLEKVAMCKI